MVWKPRHARARDENEPDIVKALLRTGEFRVLRQQDWDLVIGNIKTGRVCLQEVKVDTEKPRNDADRRHGGLTPTQRKLHLDEGWAQFIDVVRTPEESVAKARERTA